MLLRKARPELIRRAIAIAALSCVTAVLTGMFAADTAFAQTNFFQFETRPPGKPQGGSLDKPQNSFNKPGSTAKGDKQMMVQAQEVQYDHVNHRVNAVGNVQMYFDGSTVEADKVSYNQDTKRLRAEGNVRFTEASGNITYGEILELNEDYRDGFVDSLRIETPDATRFAGARADRSDGRYSVLQGGVYTACEACKNDPKKPPLWQVKAARIIHDEQEKMIYFEQAQLEFFGFPVMYYPYMSAPDPSVKRKSGWLNPIFSTASRTGFRAEVPYFWALAPNYDLTLTPSITTKQGPLMQAEFRQRLMNGAYAIRAAGIYQLDPGAFSGTPGDRDFRGQIETNGQFSLNQKWVWGWDGLLTTDKTFYSDYRPNSFIADARNPFQAYRMEGISQIYLTGRGNRSYFDARAVDYYGFSTYDVQSQLPVIHPVIDYKYIVDKPVFGGELGFNFNLTSLSRTQASFDPINNVANNLNLCNNTTADPAIRSTQNCVLRGAPGNYSRLSAEAEWKKALTDPIGMMWTPFLKLRGDVTSMNIDNQPGVSNFLDTSNTQVARGMATAGLEWRYPLINVQSWGTNTLEPIAQIIARPNETKVGQLPNEDAQSFVFDDGNLFRVDKFAGWDRVEGGGRVNYGLQWTTQFNQGGYFNVLFGQSYQLFGANSFAEKDATNTGLESGLDTRKSDYVARVSYQPDRFLTVTTRYRFDQDSFELKRFELEGQANFDRLSVKALYGNYAEQPLIGFLSRREGILGGVSYKINANWAALAYARYDLDAHKFDQTRFGVGYIDDCFVLALNYITSYNYNGTTSEDRRFLVQFGLRTLGMTEARTAAPSF